MLRQRSKNTPDNIISKLPSVVDLCVRIHRSQLKLEQNQYFCGIKHKCLILLILVPILCFFQCHNRVYNAWAGPFHLNLDQFINHWEIYSGNVTIETSFLSGLFLFDKEYFQIELGEDKIDENPKRIYRVYFRHPSFGQLLYTFNLIKEESITRVPMRLLIKLPTDLQSHFHKRLPYRFDLFNSDTLECIARQLGISSEEYRSVDIEEIYDRNATDFNMKVIIKCGILLGYLYDCPTETVFSYDSDQPYKFTYVTAVFDASSSYSPYMTYLFGGLLFLWFFMTVFVNLLQVLGHLFNRPTLFISPDMQQTLNRFNIDSIQALDYLLITAKKENNYRNRLFLVQNQYLIIFKIDLTECNTNILRQFYMTMPFFIVHIANITGISPYYISISNRFHSERIPFPMIDDHSNSDEVDWLHGRLIACSMEYRYAYEQEQYRRRQEAMQAWEEERGCRLAALIKEEEEIQQHNQENDMEQIWNRAAPASPRFIAQFRLEGPLIVSLQLSEISCDVCYEVLQAGEYYSQWPCTARHIFHYECMLNVLRRRNKCPSCRHPVEAANPIPVDIAFRLLFSRIASGVNF